MRLFMTSSLGGFTGMRDNTGSLKRGGSTGDIIPKGYRKGQLNNYTPEQEQLFQQQFGHLGPDSYLSRLAGGDEDIFNEIEQPAYRQFNEQIGRLASRFSGIGGTGSRKSSGFQNSASSYASNFAQSLQANRQILQQNALKDLMSLSNQLLGQRPQEKFLAEKQQQSSGAGGWGGVGGAALGGAGGFFLGGPAGALTGAKLGYGVGSGFD